MSTPLLWAVSQTPSVANSCSARARALKPCHSCGKDSDVSTLGVWDTAHNNGVLIYVLLADRAIAAHIPAAEWAALCAEVGERFRQGDASAGCCVAVRSVALRMARYFPAAGGDGNELPNQPVLL